MWIGVARGFDIKKFSGSPSAQGAYSLRARSKNNTKITPSVSLNEKYGWKDNLSLFKDRPSGLVEPVWCKKIRWMRTKATTKNGSIKWNVKNRVRVAFATANPPHTQRTMSSPAYGMAEIKLVITAVPQKDIWPHGRTYPKKEVAITINNKITPTLHVAENL